MKRRASVPILLATCVAVLVLASGASAQSTIWNAPSSDVQPRSGLYVEGGFDGHLEPFAAGGWRYYGIRTVYGVTNDVEAGLNAYVSDAGDYRSVELQPNAKWRIYLDERRGVAVSAGGLASLPLSREYGESAAGLLYSTASKQFGESGPRLTGGGFAVLEAEGMRGGAILGCEQPIGSRVALYADWMSGTSRFGYAGAGLGFTLSSRTTAYVGYSFGNSGASNNGLGVYVGYSF